MTLRHRLRLLGNACVRRIPGGLLRFFFKSFETHQEVAEAAGYNVYPRVFHSPFAQIDEIDWERVRKKRELPGVRLDIPGALSSLERLQPFAKELDRFPYTQKPGAPFWYDNASFTDFDAAVLYTMLRWLKPRRYIEVGCGFSSLVSAAALRTNIEEGHACEAIYADPEPRLDVRPHLDFARLLIERVQNIPPARFQTLEAGDVLFIDTSHVLKLQNDVEYELLHVLPALRPGVWIHLHDIFTPYDYPEDWLNKPLRFAGNEQYALECLLSGGRRFQVELPLYCLWKEQRPALEKLLPAGRTRPHSFWIRRMPDGE